MGANTLELDKEVAALGNTAMRVVGSSMSFHADLRSGPAALLKIPAAAITRSIECDV
jgi:hypothetical protein